MNISGYQIVVFCCFSRYVRGVGDSGENCVRSVLVVRLHNFGQVGKGDAEMFRVGCRTCDPAAPHSTVHLPSCNSLFRPFATSGVTGLRLSGLPNLPFSLVLSFPPLSSNSLSFLFFSPIFLLFTPFPPPFPSLVPFFPTNFQHFSFISSHFPLFPAFFGQADMSLCNFLANFVSREAPQTSERDMF